MTVRERLKETFGIANLTPEERRRYITDPGLTWGQWARGPFAKAYLTLAYFVIDLLTLISGLHPPDPFIFGLVVVFVYLEYLSWQYLWYRPPADVRGSRTRQFRPTPLHPVAYGRWSPEALSGHVSGLTGRELSGPDPDEFL